MKYIYRLYTQYDSADTIWDESNIVEKTLAYFDDFEKAKQYIKELLGDIQNEIVLDKDGKWVYTKGGSWALFYILERNELKEYAENHTPIANTTNTIHNERTIIKDEVKVKKLYLKTGETEESMWFKIERNPGTFPIVDIVDAETKKPLLVFCPCNYYDKNTIDVGIPLKNKSVIVTVIE